MSKEIVFVKSLLGAKFNPNSVNKDPELSSAILEYHENVLKPDGGPFQEHHGNVIVHGGVVYAACFEDDLEKV